MRRGVLLVMSVLALATSRAQAQGNLPVPPGGDPALACGQKPGGRVYWVEYGFCDVAVKGPGKANGLIFWSYGVDGRRESYRSPMPLIMRRLASAGWDVVRINRNNLYETCENAGGIMSSCWSGGGIKHVPDLIERARQARARGYDKVIAAGHSFGGAISVEANAKAPDLFHAVIALSPGHGSDVGNGSSSSGAYYSLDKQLLDVLAQQHTGRLVISLPPGDAVHPNRYRDPIGPKVHQVLLSDGLPFIQFDESLPISGHLAPIGNQFSWWFGACIQDFLDPAKSAAARETKCAAPSPLPRFMVPTSVSVPVPGTSSTSRWLGAWEGAYAQDGRDIAIVIERIDGNTATVFYSTGAGPRRELSMGFDRYTDAQIRENKINVDRGGGRALELLLSADGTQLEVAHRSPGGDKFTATLGRPAGGKL